MAGLAELAEVDVPDREALSAAVGALRTAIVAMPNGAGAALDVAARRSRLLREALELKKNWKILRKIRSSPNQATTLVKAVQTLIIASRSRFGNGSMAHCPGRRAAAPCA